MANYEIRNQKKKKNFVSDNNDLKFEIIKQTPNLFSEKYEKRIKIVVLIIRHYFFECDKFMI